MIGEYRCRLPSQLKCRIRYVDCEYCGQMKSKEDIEKLYNDALKMITQLSQKNGLTIQESAQLICDAGRKVLGL